MTEPKPINRIFNRFVGFARRELLLSIVIVTTAFAVVFYGYQVVQRMAALNAAPNDNIQWSLAQLDVELLALDLAGKQALSGNPAALKNLRDRFNVFYSRVTTIDALPIFRNGNISPASAQGLADIKTFLNSQAPTIDSDDARLQLAVPGFDMGMAKLRPLARQITLEGVKIYAAQSDKARHDFARLLTRTAIVSTFLILALGAAMVLLMTQFRVSKRRATALEASSARNASTLNTSLDAIIVADMEGRIVEFNPAAEQTFGYSRKFAVGAKLDELIIPQRFRADHVKGMARLRQTGERKVVNAGRVEMFALRANGEEFPIEFSLGTTDGPQGQLIIGFLRDISVRVNQEKEILRARDDAIQAAKAKSQFLAVMSHEMRTPLNGVMAILDLLERTKLNAKQKTYVNTAVTSSEILKQHIDDVLDLTRIQAGKLELFPRAFQVQELLEEVESLNLAVAASRNNRLTVKQSVSPLYVVGDRKRIHQVLTNFISNAIKFTRDGEIDIAMHTENPTIDFIDVVFSVSDTGLGVAHDQQQRIFEDFVTLEDAFNRTSSGAGLGLSICRDIVSAMGGTIGVESEPGAGSRFWFRLQLKKAFNELELQAAPEQKSMPMSAFKPHDVLLVDDNETNRFVARELLLSLNCTVQEADNGEQAVAKATARKFDLILMDISMPGMNGWEAAKAIRSSRNSASRKTPIHALTAHTLTADKLNDQAGLMQGSIVKPVRGRDLSKLLLALQAPAPKAMPAQRKTLVQAHFDAETLAELRDLLPAPIFAERVKAYQAELKADADNMLQLANTLPRADLKKHLHRMAGSAAVFGALELRKALSEFELAAPALKSAEVKRKASHIQRLAKAYAVELEKTV